MSTDHFGQGLYIIFARSGTVEELLQDVRSRPWSVLKDCKPGDVGLFYAGGTGGRKIWGIGIAAEQADWGEPDSNWTNSKSGFFAQHKDVWLLDRPIHLYEIKQKLPDWGLWKNLSGRRACRVPDEYRQTIAEWIVSGNPKVARLLAPWISSKYENLTIDMPASPIQARARIEVTRPERDSRFAKMIRSKSRGFCAACRFKIDYERLGILQAAHVRPVEENGTDDLTNGLPLCPNHHELFDLMLWTIKDGRIVLSRKLPPNLKRSFSSHLKLHWSLDPRQVGWRNKQFRQ